MCHCVERNVPLCRKKCASYKVQIFIKVYVALAWKKVITFFKKNPLGTVHSHMQLTLSLLVVTCHLLITFANSLDPDQDRQNVSPDLDANWLTLP